MIVSICKALFCRTSVEYQLRRKNAKLLESIRGTRKCAERITRLMPDVQRDQGAEESALQQYELLEALLADDPGGSIRLLPPREGTPSPHPRYEIIYRGESTQWAEVRFGGETRLDAIQAAVGHQVIHVIEGMPR